MKEIKVPLRHLFNDKCAYCESIVTLATSNGEVDNFRPKNGARGLDKEFSNDLYWWLYYEWRNLYYSCSNCNRYKATWFPVEGARAKSLTPYEIIIQTEKALLIDPCNDRPEEHLTYDENGIVDFLSAKGNTTIEILKLNRNELVSARKETLRSIQSQWELFLKLFSKKLSSQKNLKPIAEEWEILFSQYSTKPYVAIQRQILSKHLHSHPDVQEYLSNREYDLKLEINHATEPFDILNVVEKINKIKVLKPNEKEQITKVWETETRHFYVEKIEINNFRCFSNLEIDFSTNKVISDIKETETNPLIEPWLMFLGENGVGKSSILKALAIGLSGREYIEKLGLSSLDLLKYGADSGYIKIHAVGGIRPIEVNFNKNSISSSLFQPIVNFVGYNSIRLPAKKGKLNPEKGEFYGAKAQNLFDYTVSLIEPNAWLLKKSETVFNRAALAIKDIMLLNNEDKIIRRDGKIIVKRDNDFLNIESLSDGYQSIYTMAVDLMATLSNENVSFEFAEGIVLIDELGTHLHPRWKMQVVDQLRKTFPKIQFVVTTHEPLCLRGIHAGEIVVLTKDVQQNVIALTDLPDPSLLRVDQILTSPYFGLYSAIDPAVENDFDEYYNLLAKDNLTEDEENRKLALADRIPKIKFLGDSLREELALYVIDELLAKSIKGKTSQLNMPLLKDEAKNRVKYIWAKLDKQSFNDLRG